jgi:hypothetical protein
MTRKSQTIRIMIQELLVGTAAVVKLSFNELRQPYASEFATALCQHFVASTVICELIRQPYASEFAPTIFVPSTVIMNYANPTLFLNLRRRYAIIFGVATVSSFVGPQVILKFKPYRAERKSAV